MIHEPVTFRSRPSHAAATADADPVTTEIVRQGLNAAADQMKRALVRTAFSPVIYEILDFAARQRLIAAYAHDVTQPEWALGWRWDIVLNGSAATPFEPERMASQ